MEKELIMYEQLKESIELLYEKKKRICEEMMYISKLSSKILLLEIENSRLSTDVMILKDQMAEIIKK